jgi:ribosomal protein S18 acetylase RimI-like enzyme
MRKITPDDAPTVVELAVSSGLFSAEDAGIVEAMLADYFGGARDRGHVCVVTDAGTGTGTGTAGDHPAGVAYYQPAVETDRTWYLTMIAVRADHQGQGLGSALLRAVEDDLRGRAQRLLLVQTSGAPGFARTRAFYQTSGYQQEARVRDYYETGDDLVLFRKSLTSGKQSGAPTGS